MLPLNNKLSLCKYKLRIIQGLIRDLAGGQKFLTGKVQGQSPCVGLAGKVFKRCRGGGGGRSLVLFIIR